MYTREKRVLLRHYLEQGLSKTELARARGTPAHGVSLDRDGPAQS